MCQTIKGLRVINKGKICQHFLLLVFFQLFGLLHAGGRWFRDQIENQLVEGVDVFPAAA